MTHHQRFVDRTFDYLTAIQKGELAPNFKMKNSKDEVVCLYDLLENFTVILTYIRGDW